MARSERPLAVSLLAALALPFTAGALLAETIVGPKVDDPRAGLKVPLVLPGKPPTSTGKVRHFISLPRRFGSGRVQLANSNVKINPLEWQSVAIADSVEGEACTLTLIGPQAALLAAHCVDGGTHQASGPGATVRADVQFANATYGLTCEMPAAYVVPDPNGLGAPRTTDDFALCDLSGKVDTVASELINTRPVGIGDRILLMGFGCTNLGISTDGSYTWDPGDSTLRMGTQRIEQKDVGIYPNQAGIYLRTRTGVAKEPVLCPGDSGGPVMVVSAARREIIAVNSGLGAVPNATHSKPAFYSYLAPLGSNSFKAFMARWVGQPDTPVAQRRVREICGYNLAAGIAGCRP